MECFGSLPCRLRRGLRGLVEPIPPRCNIGPLKQKIEKSKNRVNAGEDVQLHIKRLKGRHN